MRICERVRTRVCVCVCMGVCGTCAKESPCAAAIANMSAAAASLWGGGRGEDEMEGGRGAVGGGGGMCLRSAPRPLAYMRRVLQFSCGRTHA